MTVQRPRRFQTVIGQQRCSGFQRAGTQGEVDGRGGGNESIDLGRGLSVALVAAAEAAIELCRRAGAGDTAVICSIMRDDGEMARLEDVGALLAEHGIAVAEIGALIKRCEGADT